MLTFSLNEPDLKALKIVANLDFQLHNEMARGWAGHVYEKALQGKVFYDTDVAAYGAGCEQNTLKKKNSDEINLISAEEFEAGGAGLLETYANYTYDYLEEIVEQDTITEALIEFLDMREYLLVEEGLDIWVLLKRVYRSYKSGGILPKAVIENIQWVTKKYNIEDSFLTLASHKEYDEIIDGMLCY